MANRVIIGTCGWAGADWSKRFYPDGLPVKQRLPFYAERFPFVEMIESYYQTPTRRVVEQMVSDVPDDFRFVMVVPGPIVWSEDTSGSQLKAFLSAADGMGEKLVRCVAAFDVREPDPRGVRPWEFTHDLIRYRILKLLAKWPKEIPLRIDIGAASWDDHDLDRAIRGRASWALTDPPGKHSIAELLRQRPSLVTTTEYIRLGGYGLTPLPSVVAAPVDRDERLAETAEAIKVLVKYRDVVVAVSDTFGGYAPATVDKLKALLKSSPDKEATE